MNFKGKTILHGVLALIVLGMTSCGGSGGGNPQSAATVADTLDKLGVTVDTTPRTYPDDTTIPDSEHPYGGKQFTNGYPKQELGIAGFGAFSQVVDDDPLIGPDRSKELFRGKTADGISQLRSRVGVSANTDGDASNEALFVGVSGADGTFNPYITMIEVRKENGIVTETAYENIAKQTVGSVDYVSQIYDIAAGDIDHDGLDEIVIVYRTISGAKLIILDDRVAGYKKLAETSYAWNSPLKLLMRVAMGNVDRDGNDEISVLVSTTPDATLANAGTSNYYIYDYTGAALVEKKSGPVEAVFGGVNKELTFGDIALGDIDGDGADEVIIAGVQFVSSFSGVGDTNFIMIALDDAVNNFAPIAAAEDIQTSNDPVWEPYVETWDPDGDGRDAIQVHGVLFQDFATSGGSWTKDPIFPNLQTMLGLQASPADNYTKSVAAMATGDFDWDGREELILSSSNRTCINIIGKSPDGLSYERKAYYSATLDCVSDNAPQNGNAINPLYPPILLPVDFDGDASLLRYQDRHDVVYSEPIIVAALAAAPCYSDPAIGQDTGACVTSYGLGNSSNQSVSTHSSIKVGIGFGFEAKPFGIGIEGDLDFAYTFSWYNGWETEVSQDITYTGGVLTDAVIFSSIPYDRYFYTIVNDPVEPANNGKEITFLFPRKPKTLLVSKDYYNSNTPADQTKIGAETFSHTVGNPLTYPSAAQANMWLNDGVLTGNGLKSTTAVSLSQTGSIEMELSKSTTNTQGSGHDFNFDGSIETTGGTTIKAIFGYGAGKEFGWGDTTTTAVSGSVGAITDPNLFSSKGYSWGLGTYPVHNSSGVDGEVIYPVVNYWVEL